MSSFRRERERAWENHERVSNEASPYVQRLHEAELRCIVADANVKRESELLTQIGALQAKLLTLRMFGSHLGSVRARADGEIVEDAVV